LSDKEFRNRQIKALIVKNKETRLCPETWVDRYNTRYLKGTSDSLLHDNLEKCTAANLEFISLLQGDDNEDEEEEGEEEEEHEELHQEWEQELPTPLSDSDLRWYGICREWLHCNLAYKPEHHCRMSTPTLAYMQSTNSLHYVWSDLQSMSKKEMIKGLTIACSKARTADGFRKMSAL